MSDLLGPQQFGEKNGEVFMGRDFGRQANYSDSVAALIDTETRKFIDSAHATAFEILLTHRDTLEKFARALLERETLDVKDINELFSDLPKWTKKPDEAVKPDLAPIDPPKTVVSAEATPEARQESAFSRVRNRAGRAVRGAREGFREDDPTPPAAPSARPALPRRPQLGPSA